MPRGFQWLSWNEHCPSRHDPLHDPWRDPRHDPECINLPRCLRLGGFLHPHHFAWLDLQISLGIALRHRDFQRTP